MRYSISSISNRDLQLLYHYRILRQPAELLQAVYREGVATELHFSEPVEVVEDDITLYRYDADTEIPEGLVPLLEFAFTDGIWTELQFLTDLEVSDHLELYSTYNTIDHLVIKLYWVKSLDAIQKLLSAYRDDLNALQAQLKQLEDNIGNLDSPSGYLKRPKGTPDNLVKFVDDAGVLELGDSEYKVSQPIASVQLNNPSRLQLSRMIKEINGVLTLSGTDRTERTLQGLYGSGSVIISGNGTWYLYNISLPVQLQNFSGILCMSQCADVTILKNCTVNKLEAINSIITVQGGTVDWMSLHRCAFCKQESGVVRRVDMVGAGCEYYSQIRGDHAAKQEPTIAWDCVQGTVCLSDGRIIINGKDVSFVTGHHDDPMQPTQMKVVPAGDIGQEEADKDQDQDPEGGDKHPVAGNTPEIKVYNWLINNTTLTAPAVCGLTGNIKQESGYDPFVYGGQFYGLWQTNRQGLRDLFTQAGLGNLWHTAPAWASWEGHTTEANWDQAINITLTYLVSTKYNSQGCFTYQFDKCLNKPTHQTGQDGAAAYAELACAMIERCVGGTDAIQDEGVATFVRDKLYNGTTYLYQQLAQRRDYARGIYASFVE